MITFLRLRGLLVRFVRDRALAGDPPTACANVYAARRFANSVTGAHAPNRNGGDG